jgi:anaerobic ribonucleoside-triphosphate reductase activating protein
MFQPAATLDLCKKLKENNYNVMIYTGYTYEQLVEMNNEDIMGILSLCDTLVDGRFVLKLRSLSCRFRGSTNQRLINMPETLKQGRVVTHDWGENEL